MTASPVFSATSAPALTPRQRDALRRLANHIYTRHRNGWQARGVAPAIPLATGKTLIVKGLAGSDGARLRPTAAGLAAIDALERQRAGRP